MSRVAQIVSDAPVARPGNVRQEDILRLPSVNVSLKGHSLDPMSHAAHGEEDTSQAQEADDEPAVPQGHT